MDRARRRQVQELMTAHVGVLRAAGGLCDAQRALESIAFDHPNPGTADWETSNLVTISRALSAAAQLREETRGSHWREDFPERDDERWSGHIDARLVDGTLTLQFHPESPSDRAQYGH